jgi:hypothetical protein
MTLVSGVDVLGGESTREGGGWLASSEATSRAFALVGPADVGVNFGFADELGGGATNALCPGFLFLFSLFLSLADNPDKSSGCGLGAGGVLSLTEGSGEGSIYSVFTTSISVYSSLVTSSSGGST